MTTPRPVEPASAIEITAQDDGPWSLTDVAGFFADLDSIYLYAHDQAQVAGTTERLKAIGEEAREGDADIIRPEVVFLSLASPMVIELATWAEHHLEPTLGWIVALLRRPAGQGGPIRVWPRIQEARADASAATLRRMQHEEAIQRMMQRGVAAKKAQPRRRKGTRR